MKLCLASSAAAASSSDRRPEAEVKELPEAPEMPALFFRRSDRAGPSPSSALLTFRSLAAAVLAALEAAAPAAPPSADEKVQSLGRVSILKL